MKSPPIISFVIPTLNRASILPRAIESVLNQTCSNLELVVVDDGSTDHTAEVVRAFQEDDRIIFIQQEHQGVSIARNSGARIASGDHLIFLDSDDSLDSELLECLNKKKFWEYDLIFWDVLKSLNGKTKVWKPQHLGKIFKNRKASFLAGSVCLKKKIFIEAGKYDPAISFGENYELGMRVCQKQFLKTEYINKPLLTYFIDNQDRHEKFPERLNSHLYQYNKHKDLYHAHPTANAEILRIIGFNFEKSHKISGALLYYRQSLKAYPWQIKVLAKVFYLGILK